MLDARTRKTDADTVGEESEIEAKTAAKTRNCLVCQTQFLSQWAGERICSKCKSSSTWRSG